VAAVCYRSGSDGVEFLLVQTRGGRWIFPKGGIESGLTAAQSAAIEAIEEAGVHGRIEEVSFARYVRKHESASVAAHLCEVTRLEPPQEADRNPKWFSAKKAKQRLQKDRAPEFGAELSRVVDHAVLRIQRLQRNTSANRIPRDGLQEVRFEAFEHARLHSDHRKAAFARYVVGQREAHSSAAFSVAVQAQARKVSQIAVPEELRRPVLQLGTGAPETPSNITTIDGRRRGFLSKSRSLPASKSKVFGRANRI